uniref:Uncharacterized protein n=1 Tax=Glossina palpalis gambiensis TaxID=67801 RepID=A0A1B0B989_9MUSC
MLEHARAYSILEIDTFLSNMRVQTRTPDPWATRTMRVGCLLNNLAPSRLSNSPSDILSIIVIIRLIRAIDSCSPPLVMKSCEKPEDQMPFTLSIKPSISPIPSNLLTKGLVLKGSISSMCSPVPIKMIGDLVAATADNAPPPLACPSNFVIMTEPMSTFPLKALAWASQA